MKFIPFEKSKKEWMKDPEFRKMQEREKPGLEFAKMLLSLRAKHNLTQKDLAEKLKTTQSAVSRMESGEYNPSLKQLNKIAKAFNSKVEIRLK